ncbi:MAG TPA: flagellar hook-length control protein FliK, partial [Telluria sp.]|nr:flagellar hook-length control protein FliK [Telluria sp.]
IGKSGLFYESHVADWADGKRTLAELAQEPQMQRAPAPEAGPRGAAPAADPATAQFINLQLSAGEQGRVAWLGQVWPGQQMQWEIEKDAPDSRAKQGEAAAPGWRSGLRLRFPQLGEIGATVTLAGGQLRIALEAGSGEVGGLLRSQAATLAAALEAAGAPLSSLTVRAAGERDG